tara:strand:+ start:204 stop:479 length:276 start_codon:yes stop_codon:yes gene_type:complete
MADLLSDVRRWVEQGRIFAAATTVAPRVASLTYDQTATDREAISTLLSRGGGRVLLYEVERLIECDAESAGEALTTREVRRISVALIRSAT